MTAGCSAAPAAAGGCSTSTAAAAAAPLAHLRLGRRSRRGSSSGASSSSSTSSTAPATSSLGLNARSGRKRRRHSTLSSTGAASGSEDEERGPPTFRLRLGSYVSEFRLEGTRSLSPGGQRPTSPLARHRPQPRLHTAAPTPLSETVAGAPDGADEMDLDVQSTFQAMQVDSPTASPSLASAVPFFAMRSDPSPLAPDPTWRMQPSFSSDASAGGAAPLLESRYAAMGRGGAMVPAFSALASANTVQPGVFPSASLLAARRNSRQNQPLHHLPVSPSPLSRALPQQPTRQHASASESFSHQHLYHSPNSHPQHHVHNRTRSSSIPPSQQQDLQHPVLPSPLRRHSDGTPAPHERAQ